jgi:predicted nucleic acid-binding protein
VSLFVDTSAWYSLTDSDSIHHRSASAFLSKALKEANFLVSYINLFAERLASTIPHIQ